MIDMQNQEEIFSWNYFRCISQDWMLMRYKCYDILKSILLDLWRNRDIQEKNYKIKFCRKKAFL